MIKVAIVLSSPLRSALDKLAKSSIGNGIETPRTGSLSVTSRGAPNYI